MSEDMGKKLRKVFDMMSQEQFGEELEELVPERLPEECEQHIKDLVKRKMKKENMDMAGKSKKKGIKRIRWAAAAAAFAIILTGVVANNTDNVKAAFMRLFGFVPGVGVVEVQKEDSVSVADLQKDSEVVAVSQEKAAADDETVPVVAQADKWYLLENTDVTAADDMIQLELKDAIVSGTELEIRYVVRLLKVTDNDISAAFAALESKDASALENLYRGMGYETYFSLDNAAALKLMPYSGMLFNGKEVKASTVSIGSTETTDSARTVCVSETYDVTGLLTEEAPAGTLSVKNVSVDFNMKNLDLVESMDKLAECTLVDETNGVRVMCVPTWKDDKIVVDFYTVESGKYSAVCGFNLFSGDGYVTTVNGQEMEEVDGETYVFGNEPTSFIGRQTYDLSSVSGDVTSAKIETTGLWVKQKLEGEKIDLTAPPETVSTISEILELEGTTIEFVEMSNRPCESVEDYNYSEHGLLVLKYKAEITDENKQFMYFDDIRINGEKIEGYSMEWTEESYVNMLIPLPIAYSDVSVIEFAGAQYQLNGNMEFDLMQTK